MTAQEIRHALFQGTATRLLNELAESPEFRSATTNSISSKRMDDRECVLRFLAFYRNPYTQYNKSDLDRFLGDSMEQINNLSYDSEEISRLRIVFCETMEKAKKVFGEYAFRKLYDTDARRYPINKSLFETWSVNLTNYSLDRLVPHKEQIIDAFMDLMNTDVDFERAISQGTSSVSNVKKRFSVVKNLLMEVMK